MSSVLYLLEHNRYYNFFGIALMVAIAWLLSYKRAHIAWRSVGAAFLLQFLVGFFVLKTQSGRYFIETVAAGACRLYGYADSGAAFIFGNLSDASGPWGFIFAVKVLPVIVFFGAFTAVLFYFSIIQRLVAVIGFGLQPILGTSGPETLCAIANSFLGQTEAPLVVRHYLKNMTKSEIFVVMASGMATISGAILVVFVAMGVPATHLLASSVMSVPGSIMIAKILYPETEKTGSGNRDFASNGIDNAASDSAHAHANIFDAIASGTSDGLQLALNVGAMLIVFLAFLNGINSFLSFVSGFIPSTSMMAHMHPLTVEKIVGVLFTPCGYLFGFTGEDALRAGELIGTKIAVNELIAYSHLVSMHLPDRVTAIMTYALCGFSNAACIGIQVGGIGVLVPEKRPWLTQLGVYAVIAGALTNIVSAMIAAILL